MSQLNQKYEPNQNSAKDHILYKGHNSPQTPFNTTEQETRLAAKKARTYRILKHQDDARPFVSWGTLHIRPHFDIKNFRVKIHRRAKTTGITNFVMFVEQAARSDRPHFHFLFTDNQKPAAFRDFCLSCLEDHHKIRLQVEPIIRRDRKRLFWYLAKETQPYKGRSLTQVGKVWVKSTAELGKMTRQDMRESVIRQAVKFCDTTLVTDIITGRVKEEDYLKPHFLHWWRSKHRHMSEAYNYNYEDL